MIANNMHLSDDSILDCCSKEMSKTFADTNNILFVDDRTVYSVFYQKALQRVEIKFKVIEPDALIHMKDQSAILILPVFKFRIFNLNYDKRSGSEYAAPYWVHISSDRLDNVRKFLSPRFRSVFVHPLVDFAEVLKVYLRSTSILNWISANSCPEFHNDRLDRVLLRSLLEKEGCRVDNNYQNHPCLNGEPLDEYLVKQFDIQSARSYSHFPLHRIYKKKMNMDMPINLLEREIYGNVD